MLAPTGVVAASFPDIPDTAPYAAAVRELAARGVVRGYADGRFGPTDPLLRAQTAATLVRAFGFDGDPQGRDFSDRGSTDPELWAAVRILAGRDIARGYPDGSFGPSDFLTRQQALSLISRAMVATGRWQVRIPAVPYGDVAEVHAQDVATYIHYVGSIPGVTGGGVAPGQIGATEIASRAWYAQALWPAVIQFEQGQPGSPAPSPPGSTPVPPQSRLLFGLGPTADSARNSRLANEVPVKMLTTWYNSSADLAWQRTWQDGRIPQLYAQGYALHLVVYSGGGEGSLDTAHGAACGRPYPVSASFATDMQQLAEIWAGSGPLYVTLFTEFQTYACQDNQWAGNEAYFRALKDNYRAAREIFHRAAPNSQVSLGWGGWQARFDEPSVGGGRSMLPHFRDVLDISDFQSVQAMQSDSNVDDIATMVRLLHGYGNGRVMISHLKPDNGSQAVWERDLRAIFAEPYLAARIADGLFAVSFMDQANMNANETAYRLARDIVVRYAAP